MGLRVDIRKKLPHFDLEVAFECGNETLGFLGASGCGKSMTLRCVAGVETPDEGTIVINGQTVFDSAVDVDLPPQKRKTALLFQNYQLFPNLTVGQNIAAGIDRSLGAAEQKEIVRRQLERFELDGLERRYPFGLSGGQQQRVALARMIAAGPGILMLDEPLSALDSHLKFQLEQGLHDVFDTFRGSILYVSHDIDEAYRFCDRIAIVDEGRICDIDEKTNIFKHPKSLAAIKLSGCKNTSAAVKVDDHHLEATDWGIDLFSAQRVPDDLKFVGIRGFFLKQAKGEDHNVFPLKVERVSDSRYERTAVLAPLGRESTAGRILWRIDKLNEAEDRLPERGEVVELFFDENSLYLATK